MELEEVSCKYEAMEIEQVMYMNGGEWGTRYANNSLKRVIIISSPFFTLLISSVSFIYILFSSVSFIYIEYIFLFSKGGHLESKAYTRTKLVWFVFQCFSDCIRLTDMRCSSGPNSLLPTWEVIDALDKICQRLNHKPPTLLFFFNDDVRCCLWQAGYLLEAISWATGVWFRRIIYCFKGRDKKKPKTLCVVLHCGQVKKSTSFLIVF